MERQERFRRERERERRAGPEPAPGDAAGRDPAPGDSADRDPAPGDSADREPAPRGVADREPAPRDAPDREPALRAGSDRRVPVLLNAAVGRRLGPVRERVVETLRQAGLDPRPRVVRPAELGEAVAAESRRGAAVVVVAGGDGTVSTAAAALAGRSTALGVVPAGTLNHFARRLGLTSVGQAASAIAAGRIGSVPVGTVNGRVFLNTASCGLYAHMLRHRERWRRWLTKWPAAAAAWVAVGARLPLLDVRVELPGERLIRRTPVVWVGVGAGGFRIPELGRLEQTTRELEVVSTRRATRRALVALAIRSTWRLVTGASLTDAPELETIYAARFRLDSPEPVEIALDGEPQRMDPPLEFRLEESALRVVLP